MTVDNKTGFLRLPLPHPENKLGADVNRLRQALAILDDWAGKQDTSALIASIDAAIVDMQRLVTDIGGASASKADLQTHEQAKSAHGATPSAIPDTPVLRDAGKQFSVGLPTEPGHVANKGYVDGLLSGAGGVWGDMDPDGNYVRHADSWRDITNALLGQSGLTGAISDPAAALPKGRAGALELVPGLGLFRFDPDSTALTDGETCLAAEDGEGRWECILPALDMMLALAVRAGTPDTTDPAAEDVRIIQATQSLTWSGVAKYATATASVGLGGIVLTAVPPANFPASFTFSVYPVTNGAAVRITNTSDLTATPAAGVWTFYSIGGVQ